MQRRGGTGSAAGQFQTLKGNTQLAAITVGPAIIVGPRGNLEDPWRGAVLHSVLHKRCCTSGPQKRLANFFSTSANSTTTKLD